MRGAAGSFVRVLLESHYVLLEERAAFRAGAAERAAAVVAPRDVELRDIYTAAAARCARVRERTRGSTRLAAACSARRLQQPRLDDRQRLVSDSVSAFWRELAGSLNWPDSVLKAECGNATKKRGKAPQSKRRRVADPPVSFYTTYLDPQGGPLVDTNHKDSISSTLMMQALETLVSPEYLQPIELQEDEREALASRKTLLRVKSKLMAKFTTYASAKAPRIGCLPEDASCGRGNIILEWPRDSEELPSAPGAKDVWVEGSLARLTSSHATKQLKTPVDTDRRSDLSGSKVEVYSTRPFLNQESVLVHERIVPTVCGTHSTATCKRWHVGIHREPASMYRSNKALYICSLSRAELLMLVSLLPLIVMPQPELLSAVMSLQKLSWMQELTQVTPPQQALTHLRNSVQSMYSQMGISGSPAVLDSVTISLNAVSDYLATLVSKISDPTDWLKRSGFGFYGSHPFVGYMIERRAGVCAEWDGTAAKLSNSVYMTLDMLVFCVRRHERERRKNTPSIKEDLNSFLMGAAAQSPAATTSAPTPSSSGMMMGIYAFLERYGFDLDTHQQGFLFPDNKSVTHFSAKVCPDFLGLTGYEQVIKPLGRDWTIDGSCGAGFTLPTSLTVYTNKKLFRRSQVNWTVEEELSLWFAVVRQQPLLQEKSIASCLPYVMPLLPWTEKQENGHVVPPVYPPTAIPPRDTLLRIRDAICAVNWELVRKTVSFTAGIFDQSRSLNCCIAKFLSIVMDGVYSCAPGSATTTPSVISDLVDRPTPPTTTVYILNDDSQSLLPDRYLAMAVHGESRALSPVTISGSEQAETGLNSDCFTKLEVTAPQATEQRQSEKDTAATIGVSSNTELWDKLRNLRCDLTGSDPVSNACVKCRDWFLAGRGMMSVCSYMLLSNKTDDMDALLSGQAEAGDVELLRRCMLLCETLALSRLIVLINVAQEGCERNKSRAFETLASSDRHFKQYCLNGLQAFNSGRVFLRAFKFYVNNNPRLFSAAAVSGGSATYDTQVSQCLMNNFGKVLVPVRGGWFESPQKAVSQLELVVSVCEAVCARGPVWLLLPGLAGVAVAAGPLRTALWRLALVQRARAAAEAVRLPGGEEAALAAVVAAVLGAAPARVRAAAAALPAIQIVPARAKRAQWQRPWQFAPPPPPRAWPAGYAVRAPPYAAGYPPPPGAASYYWYNKR